MRAIRTTTALMPAGRVNSGQAELASQVPDNANHFLPVLWVAQPEYSGCAFEEGATQFHSTIDFGKIDELKDLLDSLSADEIDILHLAANDYSRDQICWLLNQPLGVVEAAVFKGEGLIGAEMLPQAGLLTSMRQSTLENRYARHLAKLLMGLVDARIMRVVVDETHCGLQVLLATGQQMKLWLCADDKLEKPGWASLERVGGEFVDKDEMLRLAEQVASFVGRGRSPTETARQLLHDIAERAVDLLDQIDGDCDRESDADDWETEELEDQDEVPPSLNPHFQTERKISVPLRPSAPSVPVAVGPDRHIRANITAFPCQNPYESHSHKDAEPIAAEMCAIRIPSAPEVDNDVAGDDVADPLRGTDAQQVFMNLSRLKLLKRDIESMPAKAKGFARILHRREAEEICQWLLEKGVDLNEFGLADMMKPSQT